MSIERSSNYVPSLSKGISPVIRAKKSDHSSNREAAGPQGGRSVSGEGFCNAVIRVGCQDETVLPMECEYRYCRCRDQ